MFLFWRTVNIEEVVLEKQIKKNKTERALRDSCQHIGVHERDFYHLLAGLQRQLWGIPPDLQGPFPLSGENWHLLLPLPFYCFGCLLHRQGHYFRSRSTKWLLHLLMEGPKAGGAAAAESCSRKTGNFSLLPLAWVGAALWEMRMRRAVWRLAGAWLHEWLLEALVWAFVSSSGF